MSYIKLGVNPSIFLWTESPTKKRRLKTEGDIDGGGDKKEVDVQEPVEDQEKNEELEMDIDQDSTHEPSWDCN